MSYITLHESQLSIQIVSPSSGDILIRADILSTPSTALFSSYGNIGNEMLGWFLFKR